MYNRIVTHDDFDGVVSAALAGYFLEISSVAFAGPGDITRSALSTGEGDIVCDLPYPLSCGMWFDHHEANLEEVKLRGIEPSEIPGLHYPAKSCARVILPTRRRPGRSSGRSSSMPIATVWARSGAFGSIGSSGRTWMRTR